ncbi:MAG: arginine--tRNA ligase [Candidatus Pacebacteria bacterium]|nr:arginine--tRNA ligase [Candidatus Paceibacterota bacterium]
MKKQIENLIKEVLKNLGITEDINFNIEHPEDFKNGDYSTNVAMVYAKQLKSNPGGLAEKIKQELEKNLPKEIEKVEVAGPGFINFYLSREFFTESIEEILKKGEDWGKNELLSSKKVMVEYTQPNPFKPFHIGHLMSNAIGESISRIVEFSGAKTIRANYQGDVGPHIAKAIYGLLKFGLPDESESTSLKARYIGECYSKGSNLYDENEEIKKEIDEINKKVYDKSDEKINEIYQWGREITLEAFEEIYDLLGTKFDYYFFESEMAKIGESVVRENVGKIFDKSEESDAIVFHGENYDSKLHTRVFINSQGLPTYETKEIGLTLTKFEKEKDLDISIVTTAIEQAEYMKVVSKAISVMHPLLEKKMKHIAHGMMRFADGKMSSRKGNVITGESLLNDSINVVLEKMKEREMSEEERKDIAKKVGVSALKYSILKSSLGSDIVYDFEKSISFDGDSGPYLQYTVVRANSILEKSKDFDLSDKKEIPKEITDLEKLLYQFSEIVEYSYKEFAPHYISLYLTKISSAFNSFYGNTQILIEENKNMSYHLDLIKAFTQTMKNGLWLLGIEIPRKM